MSTVNVNIQPLINLIMTSTQYIISNQAKIMAKLENKPEDKLRDEYLRIYDELLKNIKGFEKDS